MQHSVVLNKNIHHHVIEVEVYARPESDEFVEFSDMDKLLCQVLDKYQNKYLNECEEFNGNTTMEGIGELFYRKLDEAFRASGRKIVRLSISETPLRTYSIVAEEM